MADALTSGAMSPKLLEVAKRAKREPKAQFHALAHLIDETALLRAYDGLRKDAAVGVDNVTKAAYGESLGENLRALHARLKAGLYRHQPIRRVQIPKEGGKMRPLGISTTEDKIVQSALREVLEAVYEQDFLECSHGFRPKRGAHDAIRAISAAVFSGKVNWVLEADIMSFFGAPGEAWRSQRVKFPPRQGPATHRESSLGLAEATTLVKRRQSGVRAVTQVKPLSLVRHPGADRVENLEGTSRRSAQARPPETRAGSEGTARLKRERPGTWEIPRGLHGDVEYAN